MKKYRRKRKVFAYYVCILVLGITCLTAEEVQAEGNTFVHKHDSTCYKTIKFTCESGHQYYDTYEKMEKHCTTCMVFRTHTVTCFNYRCPAFLAGGQMGGELHCDTCGTVKHESTWNFGEGHDAYREELGCGITEGTVAGVVGVSAGTKGWTKEPVSLKVSVEKRIGSFHLQAFPYSWDGGNVWSASGEYTATGNGTYTVKVKAAGGDLASASITVTNIDKNPPQIQGVTADTAGMTKEEIGIRVQAADAPEGGGSGSSGLADAAFSMDGGSTWQESASFCIKEGKIYTLTVRDKAGNEVRQNLERSSFPYPPPPVPPSETQTQTEGAPQRPEVTTKTENSQQSERARESEIPQELKIPQESEIQPRSSGQKGKKNSGSPAASGIEDDTSDVPKDAVDLIQPEETEEEKMLIKPEVKQPVKVAQQKKKVEKEEIQKKAPKQNVPEETALRSDTYFNAVPMVIGILLLLTGLCLHRLGWVTAYCYTETGEYQRLGCIMIKRGKEGIKMHLSNKITELASVQRYRIAIPLLFRIGRENRGLTVATDTGRFTVALEEFVDFVL